MRLFLMLLVSVSGFTQTNVDCLKNSLINLNYYIDGNKIKEGFSNGDLNLVVKIDHEKSNTNFIALIVYEELTGGKQAVLGVNCDKVSICKNEYDTFKFKKHLNVSDKNGVIFLDRNLKKVDYISIYYPGYVPLIYEYKELIKCGDAGLLLNR